MVTPQMLIDKPDYKHSSWASFIHVGNMRFTSIREHLRATAINSQKIETSDIVLVHNDTPRITRKLADIEELMEAKDGLLCAAKIKTAQGKTNHSIARLIPLEVSQMWPTAPIHVQMKPKQTHHQMILIHDAMRQP